MARPRTSPQPEVPGLAARRIAADILDGVLRRRIALDELLSGKNAHTGLSTLPDRDRALTRRLAATVLRRLGTLRHLVGGFLEKGFPADAPRAETILLLGAAQILWLEVPDHAAVDLSVRLAQADRRAARYAGLVNAVLRRVAQVGATAQSGDVSRDTPDWLLKRWSKTYGRDTARAIATAIGHEPALDLTVKDRRRLLGGTPARPRAANRNRAQRRRMARSRLLPGFSEGAWWVQDAAAALPVNLFGDLRGARVADLCAAPGGKTAQLALAGADVTAVDRSPARLNRLRENLARLGAESRDRRRRRAGMARRSRSMRSCSMRRALRPAPSAAIPTCPGSRAKPTFLRSRLCSSGCSTARSSMLKPGGTLVYCVCSLEPEEGEDQIAALLTRDPRVTRKPVTPQEVFGRREFVTDDGDLRTLPLHLPDPDPRWGGLDGFYAARLTRKPA